MASLQGFRPKFPTQRNRELFSRNREFLAEEQGILSAEMKLSPDEISGTKSLG